MKIIRNNIIPFRGFAAINICGVLLVRKGSAVTPRLLNHEAIHTAYRNISFEREAYACQYDMKYLRTRKHYATLKYIKENGKDKL